MAKPSRGRAVGSAIAMLTWGTLAHAHELGAGGAQGESWLGEWPLLLPLLLSGAWFLVGLARLRAKVSAGRSPLSRHALYFVVGWLILAASLLSPLHALGRFSFAAHMAEHELIMLLAAPLIALSRPLSVYLWALPPAIRHAAVAHGNSAWLRLPWRQLSTPVTATTVQAAALWLWHAPPLFDAALDNEAVHALQHLSFLFSALVFWWSMVRRGKSPGHDIVAAFCLFVTSIVTGALGALMAFSNSPWYAAYAVLGMRGLLPFGLSSVEDQQLAGLLMWVPGGLVHFAAAMLFAGRALRGTGSARCRSEPSEKLAAAPAPVGGARRTE
jgi:putative membrane protein